MTFDAILDQALTMLQRRGRVTYRTLKRQFQLDDAALDDLTHELIEGQRLAADECGTALVWTGAVPTMQPTPHQNGETERQFQTVLLAVIAMLQREQRVTYRTLTYFFGLDETLLEEVREELTLRQVAHEEQGKVLVWTGAASPVPPHRSRYASALPLPPPAHRSPGSPHRTGRGSNPAARSPERILCEPRAAGPRLSLRRSAAVDVARDCVPRARWSLARSSTGYPGLDQPALPGYPVELRAS